jgi:hypothetical protein
MLEHGAKRHDTLPRLAQLPGEAGKGEATVFADGSALRDGGLKLLLVLLQPGLLDGHARCGLARLRKLRSDLPQLFAGLVWRRLFLADIRVIQRTAQRARFAIMQLMPGLLKRGNALQQVKLCLQQRFLPLQVPLPALACLYSIPQGLSLALKLARAQLQFIQFARCFCQGFHM